MNKKLIKTSVLMSCAVMSAMSYSCIDDGYDLTKDIDMTVNIGGQELTLPVSSTDVLTLDQILDLETSSSIKKVSYNGYYGLSTDDYVLEQAGAPTSSAVNIQTVHISDMNGNTYVSSLDPFVNTGASRVSVQASPHFNVVDLKDDNVTDELLSLEEAETSVDIEFSIGYESDDFSGELFVERGFVSEFDPSWTLEILDPATAELVELIDNHTIRFKKEVPCTKTSYVVLKLRVVSIDFRDVAPGQGLYEIGRFCLNADVESNGTVSVNGTELAVGGVANLRLVTVTEVSQADLLAVTGRINPHINVDSSIFELNDIPDFLTEHDNNLDIENPMLWVSINNMSPIDIEINGKLRSENSHGTEYTAGIGADYGTSPILVKANSVNEFILSRRPVSIDNTVNIIVENLGSLISTVPDRIILDEIRAQVPSDKAYTINLGHTYDFTNTYEAIIPLVFGKDLRLTYTKEDSGWDEDLEKYNFNEVRITADVINTIPMAMVPYVKALDRAGNELSDITATVKGDVDAGTVASPATSNLEITLRSTAQNIKNLDGVRLVFDGTTDAAHVGVPLNANQTIRFDNIKVTVVGGVTIDLN